MAEVLVLVDHANGEVKKPAAEMLTIARRLGEPSAVFIGPGAETAKDLLARYGAEKIISVSDPAVGEYLVAPQAEVLAAVGMDGASHTGKTLVNILENYPRDELFQAPVAHLSQVVTSILKMVHRMRTATFLRLDTGGQFVSAIIYLPRDRYTTAVRHRIEDHLRVIARAHQPITVGRHEFRTPKKEN